MTIYINDYPLTGYRVFKRTTTDNWSILQRASDTMPYVEQTGQGATTYALTMATSSSTRHTDAAALKAVIRDCNAIRIYSDTHYLYGSSRMLWLTQTQFDVDESGGSNLAISLTGLIDPYQISTCEFALSEWVCMGTSLFLTPICHDGRYGIAQYRAMGDNRIYFGHYFPQVIDLSKITALGFWIYCDAASSGFNSAQCNIRSTNGYSLAWVASTPPNKFEWAADTWTYLKFYTANAYSGGTPPDLTSLDLFRFFLDTPAGTGNVYMCIDNIRWQ
jgi:hypothetical protein